MLIVNIVICDDELAEVEKLYSIVQKLCRNDCPDADLRGFTNYRQFFAYAKRVHIDIAFLDIYMGEYNGITAATALREINDSCAIIFVTTSTDHAISAFDVKASHYLIKPVTSDKVSEALSRTKIFSHQQKTISIVSDYVNVNLALADIQYIQVMDRCSVFHMKNGNITKTHTSLNKICDMLADEPQFITCHRNIMINAAYLANFTELDIKMVDGFQFTVPLKRYSLVKKKYLDYVFATMREA